MNKCTIYVLLDPSSGSVRYVGQTTKRLSNRLANHIMSARKDKNIGPHLRNWIMSLFKIGLKPLIKEIDVTEKGDKANNLEWHYIQKYRAEEGNNLVNSAKKGNWNYKGGRTEHTAESLKVISASSRKLMKSKRIGVARYSQDGKFLERYESVNDAQRSTGILTNNISSCCKLRMAGGFQWRYTKGRNYKKKLAGLARLGTSRIINTSVILNP